MAATTASPSDCRHLSAMEPELRRLHGLMLTARIMGEAHDHIEPDAIGALAGCSVEIIERLSANWELAFSSEARAMGGEEGTHS
ncbi:hypothetical protein NGM99_11890 [Mesorhizobium sp. RP14(2022)]|uniref:Uncharacterized protein n=1 Tax=Mesorhizobium liriopis TaxID=2953882 RepID=A0ABT1C6U8_9HYPH|nr:hypothetical protein [Mesorhizobium liriopis]MCO6050482.1 hypothetical protein [Mesorhizobium liriopis]